MDRLRRTDGLTDRQVELKSSSATKKKGIISASMQGQAVKWETFWIRFYQKCSSGYAPRILQGALKEGEVEFQNKLFKV